MGSVTKTPTALKRLLLGRPMASGELEHTLLPKTIALPVFSSDPLSSNAYATQEALLVLALAGAAGMALIFPVAVAVACLLAIVVTSYRQTVKAYPTGGGAYRVSHENLGKVPGLMAGSALLSDYTMTVAVSITAGTEAIASAFPALHEHRVGLAITFIAFVAVMNLRGIRESGTLFAIPTYGFVLSIYIMLATGFVKCVGGCPQAASASNELEPTHAITLFLILKAFAAGTTALTGVEAIADGVPAFRYPQSRNAAATLAIMGTLSISMFLGISWLADKTNVVYTEHPIGQPSVLSQIADTVFAGGPMFFVVQAMSAAILILAANTAYQDFPRLASILAKDRYMPGQFINRGDRLVFSNGIIILSLLAMTLVWVFQANLTSLIQLYLVGVFISFTLSQTGMVVRGRKLKQPGWKPRAFMSGFGAFVTGIVLCVIVATKFLGGAWIVLTAIPILMFTMHSVHAHYSRMEGQLSDPTLRPRGRRAGNQHIVILVPRVDAATARAIGIARAIRPDWIRAVALDDSALAAWRRLAPDIPIETASGLGNTRQRIKAHLRVIRQELQEDDFLTLAVPEVLKTNNLLEVVLRSRLHRLKGALLREPGVQVMDIPIVRKEIDPHFDEAQEPGRHYVVVLASKVSNATLQAVRYAETLRPTEIRAVSFGLDEEATGSLMENWLAADVQLPLEIEASPFRDLGASLTAYLKQFRPDGRDRTVTVVIPEFVVAKNRHQILHGQTALLAKRRLLFEPGVVTVSVPFHLEG
jgi:amino acid transporter